MSRVSKSSPVVITTGEKKLLALLSNFSREKLLKKNESMLVNKQKFKSFRPSSARGRIEVQEAEDDFGEEISTHQNQIGQTKTKQLFVNNERPRTAAVSSETQSECDGRLGAFQSRRYSLTGMETDMSSLARAVEENKILKASSNGKFKIEEKLTLEMLEEMKSEFDMTSEDGTIKQEYFRKIVKNKFKDVYLKDSEVDDLFRKIDCFSYGSITWEVFCNYMQSVFIKNSGRFETVNSSFFDLPAKHAPSPHREPVIRILELGSKGKKKGKSDAFACCGKDGVISYWSAASLQMKKSKCIFPSGFHRQKWVTDFIIMSDYNKIIISTGEREIQFYELSSFEPYCQIGGFETIPLQMDYCSTGPDKCIISFGDTEGCVNILVINSVRDCLRTWKRGSRESGISSVFLEKVLSNTNVQFFRWKAHHDWVQQVKYSHELRQLISCSEHEKTALVIGCIEASTMGGQKSKKNSISSIQSRKISNGTVPFGYMTCSSRSKSDEATFTVCKGVKCFDVSRVRNCIVTGGMDRNIRMWNPYLTGKPISLLRGHESPIVCVSVSDEENKVYTVSADKCLFVWDLVNQCALLSCRPKSHMIPGDVQSCRYCTSGRYMVVATEAINVINQKFQPQHQDDNLSTHGVPVHTVVYNSVFQHLVSACESSVVKMWDIFTGRKVFQFDANQDNQTITCLSLDDTCRRLFSGGRSGLIHMWNYSNGELLRTLSPSCKYNGEICSMTYAVSNNTRFLVSVGWNKQITLYLDEVEEFKQTQQPMDYWPDDLAQGHEDDIIGITFCPCNILVTSSYDGVIIVWNIVSGHRICSFMTPRTGSSVNHKRKNCHSSGQNSSRKMEAWCNDDDDDNESDNEDNSKVLREMTPKVHLLKNRCGIKSLANLVSLGSKGQVHFWNVLKSGGKYVASFKALSEDSQASLVAMATDPLDRLLVLGESEGFVRVWNIEKFCNSGAASSVGQPPLLYQWRSHVVEVTCIEVIEKVQDLFVVTSSVDGNVRVWNIFGHHVVEHCINHYQKVNINSIGTFGQEKWRLSNPSTFTHPRVPHDVLIHPKSLPIHPSLPDKRLTAYQVVFEEDDDNYNDDDDDYKCFDTQDNKKCNSGINKINNVERKHELVDKTCMKVLSAGSYAEKVGKRLCSGSQGCGSSAGSSGSECCGDGYGEERKGCRSGGNNNNKDERCRSGFVYKGVITKDSKKIKCEKQNDKLPLQQPKVSLDTKEQIVKDLINDPGFKSGSGKRLRYEKMKSKPSHYSGPSSYIRLKCHDLRPVLELELPTQIKRVKGNQALSFLAELTKT